MKIKNIKCVIIDFDMTLYSNGNLKDMNKYYAEFFFEHNLLKREENAIENLRIKYPNLHTIQCIYLLARENGIDDSETRLWLDNHIYNILSDDIKIVDKSLLEILSKKYYVFILSDSGQGYLKHYFDLFGFDWLWFDGVLTNDFKSENMAKTGLMLKIKNDYKLADDEVLMIGDSQRADIDAANAANIESYLVKTVKDTNRILNKLINAKE